MTDTLPARFRSVRLAEAVKMLAEVACVEQESVESASLNQARHSESCRVGHSAVERGGDGFGRKLLCARKGVMEFMCKTAA